MNTTGHTPACRADACQQGRKPCPCPSACEIEDPLAPARGLVFGIALAIAFWLVVGLALTAVFWG